VSTDSERAKKKEAEVRRERRDKIKRLAGRHT
jgi:hypothetical protein